jgi:hypothetical protein
MAPGAGLNSLGAGYLLDVERIIASVHVQLVQAVDCAGGI